MQNVFVRASRKTLLIIFFLAFSHASFSWGVTGHRTIAQIAQNHLSKKAKKEISKLIGKESLAWWANWMDFIKSDSTWDHVYNWHFVNASGKLGKEEYIAELKQMKGTNLYSQINAMKKELGDKSKTLQERQVALRFLIHLMGDLHQPLHVGRGEDQGGNKITVFWFDKKTNLHSLWDSGLMEFQQYSYTEYAANLDIAGKEKVKELQAGTLEDWTFESNQLAYKIYESARPEEKLGYKYNYQYQQMLDQQLLKGGLRLAAVLNEIFD